MRAAVVSHFKEPMIRELKKQGFEINTKKPDVVVAFGGEGTYQFSEIVYPGIPKLLIGHPRISKNYRKIPKYIDKLKKGQYTIQKIMKIEVNVHGRKLIGINDINMHYSPPCALRFNLSVNGRKVSDEIIGDGVVVSTPYGSGAYFNSITRKTFKNGLGIAFNNSVEKMKPIFLSDNSIIKVKIERGDGVLACDCNKKVIRLKKGDVIIIKKSNKYANIIKLKEEKIKLII